jgi:hypothetical protein
MPGAISSGRAASAPFDGFGFEVGDRITAMDACPVRSCLLGSGHQHGASLPR